MRAWKLEKRKSRENIERAEKTFFHCNILEVYKENFNNCKDRFEAGM